MDAVRVNEILKIYEDIKSGLNDAGVKLAVEQTWDVYDTTLVISVMF